MTLRSLIGGIALLAVGCGSHASTRITVTGSSTVAPLFAEIAKRFEEGRPGVRVDVQTGGSTRGAADVRRGTASLGMMSRGLLASESDLLSWPIALDGLCLIVHGDNDVPSLSADQVRAIYRGEIESWDEVGGPDLPVVVVHKAEGRATLELFLRFFEIDGALVVPDVVVGDNEQGIKTVAGSPGAVGYVSIGAASHYAEQRGGLRLLPFGGVPATTRAVESGRWPLSRELIVVAARDPEGPVRSLVEFARSEEVHDLVRALSFAPFRP